MLNKSRGNFVALSRVHDYIYRPSVFGTINLYDWIWCANKRRKSLQCRKQNETEENISEEENNSEDENELNIIGNPFIGGGTTDKSESEWMTSDYSSHCRNGTILWHAESLQNVLQDHKILCVAEQLILT